VASFDSLRVEKLSADGAHQLSAVPFILPVFARINRAGAACHPAPVHVNPDDPRTKLRRRLRKKAACFYGNRIDNSTACFVSSG
jgi:hypothetical protein